MGNSQANERPPGLSVVLGTNKMADIGGPVPSAKSSILTDSTPADIKIHFDFLWNTHRYLNESIRFADTKAGFTVALACPVVGALFAGKLQDLFLLTAPRQWSPISWLSAAAFLALGSSITMGVWTISPRLISKQPHGFLYWGGVTEHGSPETFWANMKTQSQETLVEHLAHHVFCLSQISQTKYSWARLAMALGMLGGLLAVLVLLFR